VTRHQLSASIDADLFEEIDRIAEEEGESRSEIVNQLLEDGLAKRQTMETVESASFTGVGIAGLVSLVATASVYAPFV
jgi:metal-responsive CopG/Arc/MetJ family transcriptional regulator